MSLVRRLAVSAVVKPLAQAVANIQSKGRGKIPEIVYTLMSRPMVDDLAEGATVNVSGLNIGSKQKRVKGNYATVGRDVIIDTDWWTDSDDVVAMRIAKHLEDLGFINILGIALCTTQDIGPASLEAFMIGEGRLNNRISVPNTPHTPTHGFGAYQPRLAALPHTIGTPEQTEKAVQMYRDLLSKATGKVDIIAIGFQNNLEELLKSPADTISPLTGLQLVTQKVNLLYAMGGSWPDSASAPASRNVAEYNFAKTPQAVAAASYVTANWPTEVIYSGYEVGYTIFSGANLQPLVGSDNVANAMQDHGDFPATGTKGRPSWDPLKVMLGGIGLADNDIPASIKAHGYTVTRGNASVDPTTGHNTFTTNTTGKHYYTTKVSTDTELRTRLNSMLYPGQMATTAPLVERITVSFPLANNGLENSTDYIHLLEEWSADKALVADGANVSSWQGTKRGLPAESPAGATTFPVKRASIGGKQALQFTSNLLHSQIITLPVDVTFYALVRFASTLTNTQTVFSQDRGTTNTTRSVHLKSNNVNPAQFISFSNTAGTTDSVGTGAPPANEWHVITGVRKANSIEVFFNGVTNGSTVISNPNIISQTLTIGGRGVGSEYLTGHYVGGIRVYYSAHDADTIAAVIQEMKGYVP